MLKNGEGADVQRRRPAVPCPPVHPGRTVRGVQGGALRRHEGEGRAAHRGPRHGAFNVRGAPALRLRGFLADDCDGDATENRNVLAMQHLLVAADRYGLDRLRLLCEAKLCRGIDAHTVATILALAEQHHCTQLRADCIGFIASTDVLGAVMKTDGFKHLIASCPSIMKEILDKVAAVWSD
ncbi:BTB/POZ and MATH domain-containing protein 2 [Zea mays]|jgi:hypothetical protein|uniref:Speckle-type POZ protein-like protein n=2 Tax=Zea mays TaxID=4577 RepID=A0A1D6DYL9_MAIZE|nr:Speckle-type POZ protein-like protein [Zea mays]PWZ41570.1 BTB/POZ and MATH domain-containing protein 2 [Zea mays]